MIDARDLKKSFGSVQAVRSVSFQASAGRVVGLLGPNGAGKTTVIRMITGYLPPSGGSVSVDGLDSVQDSRRLRRLIGYMPEATPLYPEMRVVDYLDYRGRLFGLRRRERRARIELCIERCRLIEMRTRRAGHLSKGYRQRLGLAASLLHDPPVLVLDEPTSGLDPAQIVETRRLIADLAADKTMILCSHILPEVERTCDELVIVARGRVRAAGATDELLRASRATAPYVMEVVAGESLNVEQTLRSTPGVAHLSAVPCEGGTRFTLTPKATAPDLREPLARAAHEAGLLVRELCRDAPSLEELFIRLIDEAADEDASTTEGATADRSPA